MGATPIATARQAATSRPRELAPSCRVDHFHHFAHGFTDLPLVVLQYVSECCSQSWWIQRWWIFRGRRFFGRWRLFWRWRIFGRWWRLGELVMSISEEDHDRISTSIRSAEAKTSGEIVCVLAQTSTHTTASPVFIAAAAALVLPWLLTAFTAMTVYQILSLQVVAFLSLLMLLCLPRVRV